MTSTCKLSNFAAVTLATLTLNACSGPLYYTSDPIEAWVVDAETGKPIEGAIVTANWQLVAFSFDTGGRKLRQLEVQETVTDKTGRFFFAGFTKLNPSLQELRGQDPQIRIFKSGYEFSGFSSDYHVSNPSPGSHRHSKADGMIFKLKKADSDIGKYAFRLGFLTTDLESIVFSGDGLRIAKMIVALNCEAQRLRKLDSRIPVSAPYDARVDVRCEQK